MDEPNGAPEDFEQAPELVVADLETLRILSDPLRMQILEVTVEAARTVKEIAQTLHTMPSKLYYHVNMLEEHGVLRVASTRIVSGIIEKRYRAVARRLRVDRVLLDPTTSGHDEVLDLLLYSILDTTRRDLDTIRAAVGSGIIDLSATAPPHRRVQVVKTLGRLTPEQAATFNQRIQQLVQEFSAMTTLNIADQGYSLTVFFHPMQLDPSREDGPAAAGDPAAQSSTL